ncbi:TPA: LPXTG cell wall anchor domain-containing protein, partial [Streptococcus suis]
GALPPLETAKGEGVTQELPQGVLPPLETAKGEGVTHELPQGVLPPLETAKGESLLFDRPILTVDEIVRRLTTGQSLSKGILVDIENSSNPAAKEKVAPVFSVRSRIGTNGQLPATGDKNNNFALLGILSAICQFIFFKVRRKSDLAIFTDWKNK